MSENKIGTMLRTPIRILLLTFCLYACSDHNKDQNLFRYDTEVIAVFSPYGTTGQTNADLLYRGMIQATDSLGISFRPIFPLTYEEGAETLAELVKDNKTGYKRLIVSTDIEYSDHLRELADNELVTDSDSTRLLVFDGDFRHQDIYTAHIPYYGMMYKAGYVASRMSDVENIMIYIANEEYRYIREGMKGFVDGFTQNKEAFYDVNNFSTTNEDSAEGFMLSSLAYATYARECVDVFDMILPLCGETVMGFLRYNREFPGSFYTVGVETDRSSYSHDVPFSCITHYDRVISQCIADWVDNRLEHYKRFGMDEGWTELMISEDYRSQLEPAAEEIHAQGIEMEESYAD